MKRSTKRKLSSRDVLTLHNTAARLGSGDGVQQNVAKSRKLYLQAAKQGSAHACYELGMSYLFDRPKRVGDGFEWLRRAARNGISDAQELLGDVYARGLFNKRKNKRLALAWYQKAVKRNSRRAKSAVRELLGKGSS